MAKVLLGFMGAGKSTVARGLNTDFVDMDAVIEQGIGMPIADFFKAKGEAAFRQVESEILADEDNQRPLFLKNSKEDLAEIFKERQAWYEEVASQVVDVATLSPEDIIEELR